MLHEYDLPRPLLQSLARPRPHAPWLLVSPGEIDPGLVHYLQPQDVVLTGQPQYLTRLNAAGVRGYMAAPESERLRVTLRSLAVAMAPIPSGTLDEVGWRLDWLWGRLTVGGLLCLTDVVFPWNISGPVQQLFLRRFTLLHRGSGIWVGQARPYALSPTQLNAEVRRGPFGQLRVLTDPPRLPDAKHALQVDAPATPTEIAEALRAVDLAGRVARRLAPGRPPHAAPPLPIRTGHLALQLACGDFDGLVGSGTHRHVVHGQVSRTPFTTELDGVRTTVDQLRVFVTAVDHTGVVQTLLGEEAAQ